MVLLSLALRYGTETLEAALIKSAAPETRSARWNLRVRLDVRMSLTCLCVQSDRRDGRSETRDETRNTGRKWGKRVFELMLKGDAGFWLRAELFRKLYRIFTFQPGLSWSSLIENI